MRHTLIFSALVLCLSSPGIASAQDESDKAPAAGPAAWKHENSKANLQALFEAIVAARKAGDASRAAALSKSVLPNRESLVKLLSEKASAELIDACVSLIGKLIERSSDRLAELFVARPEAANIKIHEASAAEIIAFEKGRTAFEEFPGGARRVAALCKPDQKLYEVVISKPGENSGVKFHLFFWDGMRWCMAGPIWRAIPEK
jgi:hypothetical protein